MKQISFFFLLMLLVGFSTSPESTYELDQLVDAWHKNASEAQFDAYFSKTHPDFVFIGTAPNERWSKTDFMAFSKPYFDRGKAWDFTPKNRKWNFSSDGKTAWFDEELETWMRDCRATGILVKVKKQWKLIHYDLHVLIENEKMDAFLQLRDQ